MVVDLEVENVLWAFESSLASSFDSSSESVLKVMTGALNL